MSFIAIDNLKNLYDKHYFDQFNDYRNNHLKSDAAIIAMRAMREGGCDYFDMIGNVTKEIHIKLQTRYESAYPKSYILSGEKNFIYYDKNITISVLYFDSKVIVSLKSGDGLCIEKHDGTFEITCANSSYINIYSLPIYNFIKNSMGLSDVEAEQLYAYINITDYKSVKNVYELEVKNVEHFLEKYIEILKNNYYERTSSEQFFEEWIPFYKVIYRSLYDPGYRISGEDLVGVIVDASLVFVSLGISFAAIGSRATNAIRSAVRAGVRAEPLRQLIRQTALAALKQTGKATLKEAVSGIVPLADLVQMSRGVIFRPIAKRGSLAKISARQGVNSDLVEMGGSTLDSARKRITGKSVPPGMSSDAYAVDMLKSEKVIDDQHAVSLTENLRSLGEGDNAAIDRIWTEPRIIQSASEFEAIAPGHLVAFSGMNGELRHTAISLGNGRFVGIRNDSLNPSLGSRQRVVFAEQFGTFSNGNFYSRRPHSRSDALQIRSGTAAGSDPAYLSKQMKIIDERQKLLIANRPKAIERRPITRVETLLGRDSEFSLIDSTLLVKLHDARVTVDTMNGVELSDAINALALRARVDLSKIEKIDLVSCGSGIGGPISTAQILADKMGIPVNASARTVNRRDLLIHPDWFSTYTPGTNPTALRIREALHLKIGDTIQTVRTWYRTWRVGRVTRSVENMSTRQVLLASIARLIDKKLTIMEFIAVSGLSDLDGAELDEAVQQVRDYIYGEEVGMEAGDDAEDIYALGFFDLVFAFPPIAQRLDLMDRESQDDTLPFSSALPTDFTPTQSSPAAYR